MYKYLVVFRRTFHVLNSSGCKVLEPNNGLLILYNGTSEPSVHMINSEVLGVNHDLGDRYAISVSQVTTNMFHLSLPQSITLFLYFDQNANCHRYSPFST